VSGVGFADPTDLVVVSDVSRRIGAAVRADLERDPLLALPRSQRNAVALKYTHTVTTPRWTSRSYRDRRLAGGGVLAVRAASSTASASGAA
jgi:hypothetical protein